MTSNIDLNVDGSLVTAFVVYRLDSFPGGHEHFQNGLFGNDNFGWDKFVCFTTRKDLLISGVDSANKHIKLSTFLNTTNPSSIGTWKVLSVQWNVNAPGYSSVWYNGKLLARFSSYAVEADTKVALGDVSTFHNVPLNGAIGEFVMYRNRYITDSSMIKHHEYFMKKWKISE
uniref:Uncharacterized protein n=1 Tax=Ciona savignyi TaxID=51511 RepID=H2ZCB5_CIOSA